MKTCFIYIFIFTFILISCGEDAINSDPNKHIQIEDQIWPMFANAYWSYNVYTEQDTGTMVLKVTKDTVVMDKWFQLSDEVELFEYLSNKTDGLHKLYLRPPWQLDNLIIKYPVVAGETYSYSEPANNVDLDLLNIVEVLSVDTLITVPAGDFVCYHYKTTETDKVLNTTRSIIHEFYVPGTGLIKYEEEYFNVRPDEELVTMELKSTGKIELED